MEAVSRSGGVLFVVATPIGNLRDITLRALDVLREVDIIAAEGVNRTRALCSHYGIRGKIKRFNQHNRRRKGPELVSLMKSGARVALVTNAGTPCISDPGTYLVSLALNSGVQVIPVPGPSAVTAALSASGIRADKFIFLGFLPARAGQRRKELNRWKTERLPLVIYEAPHRIKETIVDIFDTFGDVPISMLRELTKAHEEIRRQKAGDMLEELARREIRGEIVLVVEPLEAASESVTPNLRKDLEGQVLESGLPIKQIAKEMAEKTKVPYRKIYKICLEIRRKVQDGVD